MCSMRLLKFAIVTVVLLAAAALPAAGALNTDGFVAEPSEPESWLATAAYAVVGTAGICLVGFKKSGRTHLD